MNQNCKNCNNPLKGNFCSNYGQSSQTKRINMVDLLYDFVYVLFQVDKGFFYTTKELFLHPGQMLRDYLAGKRIQYFKPFNFLLLTATICAFLAIFLDISISYNSTWLTDGEGLSVDKYNQINHWMLEYYGIINLALLPFTSLATFLVFRRSKYNFGEHLIINTYVTGLGLIMLILSLPILYFIRKQSTGIYLQLFLSSIIYLYMYMRVFSNYPFWNRFLLLLWFFVLLLIILLSIGALVGLLFVLPN